MNTNISTAIRRLTVTGLGVATATLLAAPAATAQRDLQPAPTDVGPHAAAVSCPDLADLATLRKIASSHGSTGLGRVHLPRCVGSSRADALAGDIAYVVDRRKARYALSRIELALELVSRS
jgi:hypothetical protein